MDKNLKQEKYSQSQKGRIVIHKDSEIKRVYPNQLNEYLSQGWKRGFSDRHNNNSSNSLKGKNLGNTHGFKKGQSPWNKGVKACDNPKLQAALDKAHDSTRGKQSWNHGLTKEADDRLEKASQLQKNAWVTRRDNLTDEDRKIMADRAHNWYQNATEQQKRDRVTKQYLTQLKNGSIRHSNQENDFYQMLINNIENEGKTIVREYKCDRYPYKCDFYIVEDDLFIECNFHWTHGGMPFDKNDQLCLDLLEVWKEKAKTSKFYENAIDIWTRRDVEKLNCAKKNNLNYRVIY